MLVMDSHPLANKHIVVAGAGISGLAFAISLHKLWPASSPDNTPASSAAPPRITIYERDPCAVPKNRAGYSLSLRSDGPSAGIQTLQRMGLLDVMMERCIATMGDVKNEGEKGSGGFCVWRVVDGEVGKDGEAGEKRWERVLKVAGKTPAGCPISSMRIARAELRRTLVEAVEALPNVSIIWDTTITTVHPASDGPDEKITVALADGTTDTADLLVAADGSASKVRAALRPDDTLDFAGPVCIYAICPIESLHPSGSHQEFGSVISGHGRGLFLAPVDGGKMVWSLSRLVDSPPAPVKQPLSPEQRSQLFDEARQHGLGVYGARFERLLQATDPSTITRFNALDKPAFPHADGYVHNADLKPLEGKVVFLGDANHAVSPFAGNGANLALMDGWALAESLVLSGSPSSPSSSASASSSASSSQEGAFQHFVNSAIKRYDGLAVARAQKVVKMSHFSIRVMHSQGWWSSMWFVVLRVLQWLFFRKVE